MPDPNQMLCLGCGFMDPDVLFCPRCNRLTASVYLGAEKDCRECGLKHRAWENPSITQTYEVTDTATGSFMVDVSAALRLVDSSLAGPVPEEMLDKFLQINITEPRHYPHVKLGKPGLVAELNFPLADGSLGITYSLIDGSHRAARSIQEGKVFYAHLLPWRLTSRCMIRYQPASTHQKQT